MDVEDEAAFVRLLMSVIDQHQLNLALCGGLPRVLRLIDRHSDDIAPSIPFNRVALEEAIAALDAYCNEAI